MCTPLLSACRLLIRNAELLLFRSMDTLGIAGNRESWVDDHCVDGLSRFADHDLQVKRRHSLS